VNIDDFLKEGGINIDDINDDEDGKGKEGNKEEEKIDKSYNTDPDE